MLPDPTLPPNAAPCAAVPGAARRVTGALAVAVRAAVRLPAQLLLALVWVYQRTLSPVLPVVFPSCGCRFAPTCSHYAAEAVRRHGALLGVALALRRLVKCTPLHPGGFDPVPTTVRFRPTCRRVTPENAIAAPATARRSPLTA